MIELKVEVLYGRAVLAGLILDDHNGNPNKLFSKVYRGDRGEGDERPYDPTDPARAFHEGLEHASLRWIFAEGHMPCVWTLAEKVARAMAADQVRVDIFVAQYHPEGCIVNEISLSSGHPYGTADRYLASLWLEPIARGLFRSLPVEIGETPVYHMPPAPTLHDASASRGHSSQHTNGSDHDTAHCLNDGSVVDGGIRLHATTPCDWGRAPPKRMHQSDQPCAAQKLLADVRSGRLMRSDIELVIVAGASEDVAWSNPYSQIRTVVKGSAHGREMQAYLRHIVDRYDSSLAARTVFMHGRRPTCGFGVNPVTGDRGGHLLSGVAVQSYLSSTSDVFMPFTGRFTASLSSLSWRNSFMHAVNVTAPVGLYPNQSEEHWLPFHAEAFGDFVRAQAAKFATAARPVWTFAQYYRELFGEAPPPTICFAQGAQLAASRDAIRRVPLATYEKLLHWIADEKRVEVVYYLELTWAHLLLTSDELKPCLNAHSSQADVGTETSADARALRRLIHTDYLYYGSGSDTPSCVDQTRCPEAPPTCAEFLTFFDEGGCASTCDKETQLHLFGQFETWSGTECSFMPPPPPATTTSPPPPPHSYLVKVVLTVSGSVEDYTEAVLYGVKQRFAAIANVDVDSVFVTAEPGSVILRVQIRAPTEAVLQTIKEEIAPHVANATAATTLLASVDVGPQATPIVVTAASPVEIENLNTDKSGALGGGVIAGIIIAALVGALCLIGVLYWMRKKMVRPLSQASIEANQVEMKRGV